MNGLDCLSILACDDVDAQLIIVWLPFYPFFFLTSFLLPFLLDGRDSGGFMGRVLSLFS